MISLPKRWFAPLAAVALLLAACGGNDRGATAAADDFSPSAVSASQRNLQVQLISSSIGTGPTRVPFGILRPDPLDSNSTLLVHDAVASARIYKLRGDRGTLISTHDLAPVTLFEASPGSHAAAGHQSAAADPLATVYVATVDFTEDEWWGAEVTIQRGSEPPQNVKVKFFVSASGHGPAIGEAVPPSRQLIARDVADLSMIDSSDPQRPELHQMTVADATASGRPTVVAFATPAFCQTRFCGPIIASVVGPLEEEYRDQVNFLHIEPYKLAEARNGRLVAVPEMAQWGLQSEPWVFVLDADGKVVAKYEGITSAEEVRSAIDATTK